MQNADRKSVSIPWNKGKLVGQKHPLKLEEIWEIWIRLQLADDKRGLALFNLAIESKLRGCDLVKIKVSDVVQGSHVQSRAIIMQQKTHRPVQFEITEHTRMALEDWIKAANLKSDQYLVTSRLHGSQHLSTRQSGAMLKSGSNQSGLIQPGTVHTACAEPKQRWFIGKLKTCGPCNYCLDIANLKVPLDIWGSK